MIQDAGQKAIAAFSADVEDYFQVEALREFCPREKWDSFEDRTVPNTERLLAVLEEHNARGTFFVLGWNAKRHPDLVKRIAGAGHEVASHGYSHELVYRQTPEEFREDVRKTRSLLQDLSGQEVVGYRAPSYTIMARTRWALPILAEEGYRYDSSIFPIRRRRYGEPGAPRWPHRISIPDRDDLTEFPLPTVRFGFFNFPATGGAYLRLLPLGFQKWAVRGYLSRKQPFVVNIHPWELDPEQPRFPVSRATRITHYHNLDQTRSRLKEIMSQTEFTTVRSVLENQGFSVIL